jgi:lysophospholipase L1-like esterase
MKKMAVYDGTNTIKNVAVWDGISPWSLSGSAGEVTGRRLAIGQTYISMANDTSAYTVVIDGNSIPSFAGVRAIEQGLIDAGVSTDAISNVAIGGKATTDLIISAGALVDPKFNPLYGWKNVCFIWEIINDIKNGTLSAQQVFDNIKNYCQARKAIGWKNVVGTCLPWQLSGATNEQKRLDVNDMLRAELASGSSLWLDALADVASDSVMGNAATCSDPAYYSDGTHPTALGQSLLKIYFKNAFLSLHS